jgi:hypothetical protein
MSNLPPGGQSPTYYSPRSSGKATAALVLGILGLVTCGPFAAIPAIIVGRSAQREIDASGGAITGRTSASAGVVLGWIEIGLLALGLVIVVFVFVFGSALGLGSD